MIQHRGGLGLDAEAFDRGRVFGQRRRQHLDGGAAAHHLVFGQVHGAGAAGAEALDDPVAADVEALVLAQQELFGLEGGDQALADEQRGELARFGGHVLAPGEEGVEARVVDLVTFPRDFEESVDGSDDRHLTPPRRNRPPGRQGSAGGCISGKRAKELSKL
jgi:hypothetical protein